MAEEKRPTRRRVSAIGVAAGLGVLGAALIGLRLALGAHPQPGAHPVRSLPAPPSPLWPLTPGRLDRDVQETLSLLLLLPYGVLLTAVFRNLVGVMTFGTFTPSLVALSFTDVDWRVSAVILAGILLIGMGGRRLLDRLQLLMVPRLGLVITAAVLYMALAVSVLGLFQLTPSPRAVLLPAVILTGVIERFHVSAEENGLRLALTQLGWTLVVGGCCWALFGMGWVRRTVVGFPESLFLVGAALTLLGRYGGYRLVELWRFRDLGAPPPQTPGSP